MEGLILSCLEKGPLERPSSAVEVTAALPEGDAVSQVKCLLVSRLVRHRQEELREDQARYLESLHQRVLHTLLKEHRGSEIGKSADTLQVLFHRPIQAVRHALAYHRALGNLSESEGVALTARVGIHLCEVSPSEDEAPDAAPWPKVMDLATAELLSSLAEVGQILMTKAAFDQARQSPASGFHGVRWLAHGSYEMAGSVESLEIYEVGEEGVAVLKAPGDSLQGRRRIVQETISGWRPAPDQDLPHRPNWVVERRLSEGGGGEVWLAVNRKTRERRVFKFCYDPARLRSLQREIALFRLLKETLGERDDITRVLDWNFDEAPYFIESEYTAGGSLVEWAESQGGLERIPLATRLDIVAQVATALAAAHSVGVLHKDVKPGNVLVTTDADGRVRSRLSDFGVGLVTERQRLVDAGITILGMTDLRASEVSPGGTRLYMAPELLEGKPATLQADIYALGVMLYQMVVGDLSRAMAPGWDRDVKEDLLRDDIAAAVDGSPRRRLSSALLLAERLSSLEERHKKRTAHESSRRRRKLMATATRMLAVFALALAVLLFRVGQEAARANREAQTAQQVSDFLVDLFEVSAPGQALGNKITAREILDQGAEKIKNELQEQPRVQARLMHTMGVVYESLGLYKPADSLLREALVNRRELYGDIHPEVAETLNAVARVLLQTGNYEQAITMSRESLTIRRMLLPNDHADVASSLHTLARALSYEGSFAESETHYREALDIRRHTLGHQHEHVAATMIDLADLLMARGDLGAAEPFYSQALDIRVHSLGEEHPDVAESLSSMASLLQAKGDRGTAKSFLRRSLEMRLRLLGEEHPSVANSMSKLANLLRREGDYGQAEHFYRRSIGIRSHLLGENHRL